MPKTQGNNAYNKCFWKNQSCSMNENINDHESHVIQRTWTQYKYMHGLSTPNPIESSVDSGCIKHIKPYIIHFKNYHQLLFLTCIMTRSWEGLCAICGCDAPILNDTNMMLMMRLSCAPNLPYTHLNGTSCLNACWRPHKEAHHSSPT